MPREDVKARAPLRAGEEGKARGSTEPFTLHSYLSAVTVIHERGLRCQSGICVFQNDLTGEHSCIMLKTLTDDSEAEQGAWLAAFWKGTSTWKSDSGWPAGASSPLTLAVPHRFPKAVPSSAVLPVQHLPSCPGSEHHSEQEHREAGTAR